MNLIAGIIDQQVTGLAQRLGTRIDEVMGVKLDDGRRRSAAFVLLCCNTLLELDDEQALEALTEGTQDFGVDAIFASDPVDHEFTITLIQCKYDTSLEGNSNFSEDGVIKAIQAVRTFLEPRAQVKANRRVVEKVEEIRALMLEGNYPRVRVLLCNNGLTWKWPEAQALIDNEGFGDVARFEHINHDVLLGIATRQQTIDDMISFSGRWLVEDLSYCRAFIGKVPVEELARLMDAHGDRLLERNIRRYLGLRGNRVNQQIQGSLVDPQERPNFFFYNNGLTLVCRQFQHNAGQQYDPKVRVKGLQIINGGQTCRTIQQTIQGLTDEQRTNLDQAYVLVRLYQVGDDGQSVIQRITEATNSQNPVDLRDLRSNEEVQQRLQLGLAELGYTYRRHRTDQSTNPATDVSSVAVAEAVLSIWRRRPHELKFHSRDLFGRMYADIFRPSLNATQAVVAVQLFRVAERYRKAPPAADSELVRYGSYFVAMLMGQYLLADLGLTLDRLTHKKHADAHRLIEERAEAYFFRGLAAIKAAVDELYGSTEVSLQRLAATFRRGDLLEILEKPSSHSGRT
jgi:hypothetical protein